MSDQWTEDEIKASMREIADAKRDAERYRKLRRWLVSAAPLGPGLYAGINLDAAVDQIPDQAGSKP